MLPFINVFGRDVPMYGICMITGAFFAILFACLAAKKKGLQRIDVLLASFFCFIFGLIGAKILYIITDIPNITAHFKTNEFDWMWLFQRMANAGIVFYGGLIGGLFGGWIYVRMFRLDFWKHADAMVPYMPLAHAFGRLGCFCAGCCYGRELDPPFGWYFPNAIGAPHDIPLFPVQLFESCFLFIVLFPLMQFYSRKRRLPGQVMGMYLTVYGIFRFFNEFLRNDTIRGIFGGVSTSQWISLVLIPIGVTLLSGKISGALVSRRAAENAYGGEENAEADESYIEEDDGFVPPCAVCTGCGECDRRREEAAARKAEEEAGELEEEAEDEVEALDEEAGDEAEEEAEDEVEALDEEAGDEFEEEAADDFEEEAGDEFEEEAEDEFEEEAEDEFEEEAEDEFEEEAEDEFEEEAGDELEEEAEEEFD